jgi:hypothetical protein
MTETVQAAMRSTTPLADPTVGFRRISSAIALPAAFACQLVANTLYAQAVASSGLSDAGPGSETLEFYARFPGELQAATLLALVGSLLAIPGLLGALRLIRPRKPRLGLWAIGLMIAGYVCYFGVNTTNFATLALAQLRPDAGDVAEATQNFPTAMPVFIVFVIGNLGGTLLLGIAVILTRDLPWYAGALVIGWPVGHIVNLVGGGEWFAVAGGALEVVGLGILAGIALRTTNAVWAARG